MASKRLTQREWQAVSYAISVATAGVLDGIEEDMPEYVDMIEALHSAWAKVLDRIRVGPDPPDG